MSETATSPSAVQVGLPNGVDPQKVKERAEALVKHGTHPLHAVKLATDAEEQQVLIDAHKAKEAEEREKSEAKSKSKKEGK